MIHLIEAVFQKDFTTEYMIITVSSEESKNNHYDIQVIQNNTIEGLLKLQVRDVNQEMQYFYDIKGYISMAELRYTWMSILFIIVRKHKDARLHIFQDIVSQ